MAKNLKLSYILYFSFSAVLIAWATLASFFNGVAINYIGILGLTFASLLLIFADKSLFRRIKDIFFICCGFCFLELFIYFAFELGWCNINSIKGFLIYQKILSLLGFLFFTYIAFRFVCEMKNKRIKFIEMMLGNEKRSVKVKKAKEVSNGSLEDKPNNNHYHNFNDAEEKNIETEE